jgi:hypothetical protein
VKSFLSVCSVACTGSPWQQSRHTVSQLFTDSQEKEAREGAFGVTWKPRDGSVAASPAVRETSLQVGNSSYGVGPTAG